MKVSLSWLKEYTPVADTPSDMASKLTMAGLEVDSYVDWFGYLDAIVVARVETVTPHPMADKLSCCTVDAGQQALLSIVCGAPNVRPGMLAPCALPGAVLPSGVVIKKSKLRGEDSEGMLCSASELMLDNDSSGILELDPGLVPGVPLAEALDLKDPVFEIDLTPNRPDCLSVIGIAREVAAFQNPRGEVKVPETGFTEHQKQGNAICDYIKVDILDPDLCPRYTAAMLVDVTVGPSPMWLQRRLESVGLTPINNIVDVTNFIMLETGQPLHAFDYDFIAGARIEVRRAGGSIPFTTLDGKEHTLEPDMLMICDGERPVGIAGVMGGENSEILGTTKRVLLESAYFNPISIRKTAKISGINTDASHRFERGVDPKGSDYALMRAAALMAKLSGATIVEGIIDEHPLVSELADIALDIDFLNRRLGTQLSLVEIKDLLESVGFKANQTSDGELMVTVPSFRVDVTRPEDLSEEVARLWGYNNIKTRFPAIPSTAVAVSPRIGLRTTIREIMNGYGFSEAVNYSFVNAIAGDYLDLDPDDERRKVENIKNPISEDMGVLRTTLLAGLLDTMRRNNSQETDTLRMFEIGNTFFAKQEGVQPKEIEMIAGLWCGARQDTAWYSKRISCDFFDIKGVVEGLLSALRIDGVHFVRADKKKFPYYKQGYGACIMKGAHDLGNIGRIASDPLKRFGLKLDAYYFELDLDGILSQVPDVITARSLPKFPSVSRDITLVLDVQIEASKVMAEFEAAKSVEPLIEEVFLFDVYEGKPLKAGKKSVSFRVIYRSGEKTLKKKAVDAIHDHITKEIMQRCNADLPV